MPWHDGTSLNLSFFVRLNEYCRETNRIERGVMAYSQFLACMLQKTRKKVTYLARSMLL